jgi:hypothetical protein
MSSPPPTVRCAASFVIRVVGQLSPKSKRLISTKSKSLVGCDAPSPILVKYLRITSDVLLMLFSVSCLNC